jgi:hypothetical protein
MTIRIILAILAVNTNCVLGEKPKEYDNSEKEKKYDQLRADRYLQLVFTSSWELRREKLLSYAKDSELNIFTQKSMVAFSFNYWVLKEKKLIPQLSAFETQIKKSFANYEIDLKYLDNPIAEPFALSGPQLLDVEYKKYSVKFKDFIIE